MFTLMFQLTNCPPEEMAAQLTSSPPHSPRQHRGPRGLVLCHPQPQPGYQSTLLTRYGVVPTDLAGLVQPPAIRFSNCSYQLEKLLALPLVINYESVVQTPRVAGSCLAVTFLHEREWSGVEGGSGKGVEPGGSSPC